MHQRRSSPFREQEGPTVRCAEWKGKAGDGLASMSGARLGWVHYYLGRRQLLEGGRAGFIITWVGWDYPHGRMRPGSLLLGR